MCIPRTSATQHAVRASDYHARREQTIMQRAPTCRATAVRATKRITPRRDKHHQTRIAATSQPTCTNSTSPSAFAIPYRITDRTSVLIDSDHVVIYARKRMRAARSNAQATAWRRRHQPDEMPTGRIIVPLPKYAQATEAVTKVTRVPRLHSGSAERSQSRVYYADEQRGPYHKQEQKFLPDMQACASVRRPQHSARQQRISKTTARQMRERTSCVRGRTRAKHRRHAARLRSAIARSMSHALARIDILQRAASKQECVRRCRRHRSAENISAHITAETMLRLHHSAAWRIINTDACYAARCRSRE